MDARYLYYCTATKRHLSTMVGSTCHPKKLLCDGCKNEYLSGSHLEIKCKLNEFPEPRLIRIWIDKDRNYIESLGLLKEFES